MSAPIFLRIHHEDGTQTTHALTPGSYVLGRDPSCDVVISYQGVSRRHARLTLGEDFVEVEDLGSTAGTWLQEVHVTIPRKARLPSVLTLGPLLVEIHAPRRPSILPSCHESSVQPLRESTGSVGLQLKASVAEAPPLQGLDEQARKRLEMLYEMPLLLAAERQLDRLFHLSLERILVLIPGAVRGALLIKDPQTGHLEIRASIPQNAPPISRTLIERAANEHTGFIWGDNDQDQTEVSASMAAIRVRTGMYVPLIWKNESIGVLFVDNPERRHAFSQDDLRFLLSVAHYTAAAVANKLLQQTIEHNNKTLEHLLANFSPKIRRRLLDKSRQGQLRAGGEKSTVTILLCDLRGFTVASQSLDAQVVVDMLNDYFQALGQEIFHNDGTIDKFMGDAILAVFGSPEPDAFHARKAVQAAIDMQRTMAIVNQRRQRLGLPVCELGIGVHTGEVLHGFIGADDRLEYTVIGDPVNKASRYCDCAPGGKVILGPATYDWIVGEFPASPCLISSKHQGQLHAYLLHWEQVLAQRRAV